MSRSVIRSYTRGIQELSYRDLAVYVVFGLISNVLVVVGLPKVGGALAAMVLATYLAALSDAGGELQDVA